MYANESQNNYAICNLCFSTGMIWDCFNCLAFFRRCWTSVSL